MHIPKRIIRLAQDRALSSFSVLSEQTVVEADALATKAMLDTAFGQRKELDEVRAFLRSEGRTLRTRIDRHFASLLERAMVTMHVDTRRSSNLDIDYATLTLIDDDVVVRQIEVDRVVARLRDAEPVPLGRLNLTIAVMHDDPDARERENPFRPYLLGRALYEGVRELVFDPARGKIVFDLLGQSMTRCLPGFYAGILEVFEAGGITARLVARPGAMSRAERERMAWRDAADQLRDWRPGGGPAPVDVDYPDRARMLPLLERLRQFQQNGGGGGGAGGGGGGMASGAGDAVGREHDLVDVIWNLFHKPKSAPGAPADAPPAESDAGSPVEVALLKLQREIAAGGASPAPRALRDQLEAVATADELRLVEVVILLFEAMLQDDMLSKPLQSQLARLLVPFTRAVLIQPDLLHDGRHPARALVDRIGSIGVGVTPDMEPYNAIDKEVQSVIGAVLELFANDMHMFSDAEHALDVHVSALLAASDPRIARCAAAVDEAQLASRRLAGATSSLSAKLQPLQIDPRVADFILGTWARVLSQPGEGSQASIALLPDLLWSAQAKVTPEERSAMMRMLPELVAKVRAGMASIWLPEAPSKAAFDRLVAVHMDVLGNKQALARQPLTLDEFRTHFADFAIDTAKVAGSAKDGWIGLFELEAAMIRRDAKIKLNARSAARMPQASDAEYLAWARPGNGFEIMVDDAYCQAVLSAVTDDNSAFLFTAAKGETQVLYLRGTLLDAFETTHVRPLEFAPLFDRAVSTLMAGAETLS